MSQLLLEELTDLQIKLLTLGLSEVFGGLSREELNEQTEKYTQARVALMTQYADGSEAEKETLLTLLSELDTLKVSDEAGADGIAPIAKQINELSDKLFAIRLDVCGHIRMLGIVICHMNETLKTRA